MAALVFYGIAAFFTVLCSVLVFFVGKNKLAIYYLDWTKNQEVQSKDLLDYNDSADYNIIGKGNSGSSVQSIAVEPKKETCGSYFIAVKRNFSITSGMLYSLLWVFMMTFIVFPSVSNATSLNFLFNANQKFSWANLIFSFVFNLFDTIGRKMAGTACGDMSLTKVKICSFMRIIFWPTFFLTAFMVGPSWLFWSDWFKIA